MDDAPSERCASGHLLHDATSTVPPVHLGVVSALQLVTCTSVPHGVSSLHAHAPDGGPPLLAQQYFAVHWLCELPPVETPAQSH